MSDTLQSAMTMLNNMTDQQYVVVLVKMVGLIVVALTGLFTLFVSGYKAFLVVWGMAVRHMSQSLSPNYVPREEFDSRLSAILTSIENMAGLATGNLSRMDEGAKRMATLEEHLFKHIGDSHAH